MLIIKSSVLYNFLKKQFAKLTPIYGVSLARNLVATFTAILAFSILIYILVIYPLDGDKASSLASMFGFSATLFAPVAAFFLINNWKEQTKYNALMGYIAEIISEKAILTDQLEDIRRNKDVFVYLDGLIIDKLKLNEISKNLSLPQFNDIYSTLEKIRVINLKIMMYDPQLKSHIFIAKQNGFDSFYKLEACVKGLEACFFKIYTLQQPIPKDVNSNEYVDFLQRCLYINSFFSNQYRSKIDPSIHDKYTEKLNQTINESFEDIKEFRKSLK